MFRRASKDPDLPAPVVVPPKDPDVVTTSKVFPKFLSALGQQPAPVLLDLGPVVGSNITFFGERLGCKIYIEDLVGDVESHARRNERGRLSQFFRGRLTQEPDSVDGVLCWDLFDFIDKPSGQVLAAQLSKMLRKGGALFGYFGTTTIDLANYSRYVIEADDRLRMRPFPASPIRRNVLLTGDIIKMFDGLTISESVLLKSSTRETLFRKT